MREKVRNVILITIGVVAAGSIIFGVGKLIWSTMTPVGSVWIHESVDPWAAETTPKSVVKDARGDWVKVCVPDLKRDDYGRLIEGQQCSVMRAGELRVFYRRVE